jgi:hypothetical protein
MLSAVLGYMTARARSGSRLRKFATPAAAGLALTLASFWLHTSDRERGSRLFHGGAALTGRLLGHVEPLPPEATRCENCHRLESDPPRPAPTGNPPALAAETAGPKLGRSALTTTAKRRGGPASAYTADAFCRLLREGVDPVEIVIPKLMPRYTLTDAECNELWAYLISN